MDLVIYTEGLAFDGKTPFERSLGGSESAVVFLSRELARRGHRVQVFCQQETSSADCAEYEGVIYHDLTEWPRFVEEGECDVLVCCRHLRGLATPANSKVNIVWNHDLITKPAAQQLMSLMYKVDKLFVLSEFHRQQFAHHLEVPADCYVVTRNGVDLELVAEAVEGVARDRSRLIYTSRPERGLDVLLQMWPELKARRPKLKLAVASYENPGADAQMADYLRALRTLGEHLPDIEFLGALSKSELYREIAASGLLLYPAAFPEVSCITAMEAAACGTPVVASRYCALKETVADGETGVLIPGDPHDEEYQRAFVEAVAGLIEDDTRWQQMSEAGKRRVEARYQWSQIAEEWEEIFAELVAEAVASAQQGRQSVSVGQERPLLPQAHEKNSNRRGAQQCALNPLAGTITQHGGRRYTHPTAQSVSVCLIVKDGQGTLYRCLDSVKSIADEIIVCDTGSHDRTMEIAREYTDQVYEIPWEDDFAASRNRSIEKATKDWILWIDADEYLVGAENLGKYLRENMYNGYVIRQHHHALDAEFKPDVPVRLFRNHKGIKFFGCVHEHPETALNEGVKPAVILSDVHIMHDGYVTEAIRRKRFLRNLPMVLKDRKRHPERRLGLVFLERDYIHLARYELERTRSVMTERAQKYLERAVAIHREHFTSPKDPLHGYSFPLYQSALELMGEGFTLGYFMSVGEEAPDGGDGRRAWVRPPYSNGTGPMQHVRVGNETEAREFLVRHLEALLREVRVEEEFPFEEAA